MYKVYNFEVSPKDFYVIGDAHGAFNLLHHKIKQHDIKNSIIAIAGDCGFGFHKPEYYKQVYDSMKITLSERNVTILGIRGNHDDPTYFGGVNNIDYEYFKTIEDYGIISLQEGHNILCVGGGTSIDRTYRKEHQAATGRVSYWEDELPVYKPEILDKMKEDGILIDTIIAHSAPTFAPLHDKIGIEFWLTRDPHLAETIDEERGVLTALYNKVIADKHPLRKYIYGHFHRHVDYVSEDQVLFKMLNCVSDDNNSWDIYQLRSTMY